MRQSRRHRETRITIGKCTPQSIDFMQSLCDTSMTYQFFDVVETPIAVFVFTYGDVMYEVFIGQIPIASFPRDHELSD